MTKLTWISLALLLLVSPLACQTHSAQPASRQASESVEQADTESAVLKLLLRLPLTKPSIVVKKAQRQLVLFSDGKVVRTYRIGLGLSPVGDKVRAGDRRTPEGSFYVFTKNPKSAFYLSLGLSYPNAQHAQRGLRDGLITRLQYGKIANAGSCDLVDRFFRSKPCSQNKKLETCYTEAQGYSDRLLTRGEISGLALIVLLGSHRL